VTRIDPFGHGSVSFGPYAQDLPVRERIANLLIQARLAADGGFDGLTMSEHHAGFAHYLPNPLQVVGWFLEQTSIPWVAACPILLSLRQPPLVVEDLAWLAARHPGRVGVGFAPGYAAEDFELVGRPLAGRFQVFEEGLNLVAASLRGQVSGPLAQDDAVRALAQRPMSIVSAAASTAAVLRAARAGVGLVLGAFISPERAQSLVDEYRDAGGTGPCVLIRRGWIGELPAGALDSVLGSYQQVKGNTSFLAEGSVAELVVGEGEAVRARLQAVWKSSGCTALSLRVHFPGVAVEAVHEQIELFGSVASKLVGP
jgi:alkanesulfonate monooxygenase SsuD/methylene tetrahydromethanopterin reductase-like flavin-dependent oxidoreductase (luciferase family)